MSDQEELTPHSLNVIRLALLSGALLFGLCAWIVGGAEGLAPELLEGVELYVGGVLILLFLGLFGGLLVVQAQWRSAETFSEKGSRNIVGWALAETAGLAGGLYLMLGGTPIFFGAGIALQGLASFVLLPVPEE